MNMEKSIKLKLGEIDVLVELLDKEISTLQKQSNLLLKESKSNIEEFEETIDKIKFLKYTLNKLNYWS